MENLYKDEIRALSSILKSNKNFEKLSFVTKANIALKLINALKWSKNLNKKFKHVLNTVYYTGANIDEQISLLSSSKDVLYRYLTTIDELAKEDISLLPEEIILLKQNAEKLEAILLNTTELMKKE